MVEVVKSSTGKKVVNPLSAGAIISIACRMLKYINKQILFHNERTAFIALHLARHMGLGKEYSLQNLVILALFHTIGFFNGTDFFSYSDTDEDIDYFSKNHEVESKYVFSCYYLEYMTPLKQDALSLENFLEPYNKDMENYLYQEKIKSILYFSARISDYIRRNPGQPLPQDLTTLAPGQFNPLVIQSFLRINQGNSLINQITQKTHLDYLYNYISKISLSEKDKNSYLKLLTYFLDFKSTSTMTHSINTSCYALAIGMRFNLSQDDISQLFISSMLHDIGKICTPQRILEAPGKLSPEEMGIMRYHVNHSRKILCDLVSDGIMEDVYRHHEKLNGSGYPNHLTESEITLIQRIITIADITSALNDSRSYKGKFESDKTFSILQDMTDAGELDKNVIEVLFTQYSSILKDLRIFQKTLQADFSTIFSKYNDFVFSDITSIDINNIVDEIEVAEEI